MQRTLTIKRKSHIWVASLAKAAVILDGEEIGRLKNGEENTWQISESAHSLIIKSPLVTSDEIFISAGSSNAAFKLDIGQKNASRSCWVLTEIEAPPSEADNAAAAQADEDEAYRKKIGGLVGKILNSSDEDAFYELEDLNDTSLEVLGRHEDNPDYISMYGLHQLGLAKYILEDIYNIDEAESYALKAEAAFRMAYFKKRDLGEDLSETELYHRVAIYHDAYCKYYRNDLHDALEEIESYPATLGSLALAGLCQTKIAMAEDGDLYDAYKALQFWEEKVFTEGPYLVGIMTEDIYSTAYAAMTILMTQDSKDDPRIPSGKTEIDALVQNMEKMKKLFKEEETIAKLDYAINQCQSYLEELLTKTSHT